MRQIRRTLALCPVLVSLVLGVTASSLLAQQPAQPNRFEREIAAYEALDQQKAPPAGAVLFVGSSSIRLWDTAKLFPDIVTINRGFGGSQLADSVFFAKRIVLPYQPAKIVLYAGDNDLNAGKTPEQVFADYTAFVELIHRELPQTEVIYIGIKPSIARWKIVDQGRETNNLIREYGNDRPWLKFVAVEAAMLGADGQPKKELYRADGLHLTDEGYKVWNDLLRPYLDGKSS